MSTEAILYCEVDLLCAIFMMVMLFNLRNARYKSAEDTIFYRGVLTTWIILLTDILAKIFNGVPGTFVRWFLYVDNAIYFLCTGLLCFYCLMYVDYTVCDDKSVAEGRRMMYLIPAFALGAVSFLSLKTGTLFYITEDNLYSRGPLHVVQQIVTCLYFVVALFYSIGSYVTTKNLIKKSVVVKMIEFTTVPFIGMIIQILVPDLVIIWPAASIGMFIVFSELENSRITLDPLTGLNNRSRLIRYLADRCEKVRDDQYLTCIVIDIDNLKSINDRYGHKYGDEVLTQVADVVKHSVVGINGSCFLARYSGNAYVVASLSQEKGVEAKIISRFRELLEELNTSGTNSFQIIANVGFAIFEGKDNMSSDDFIKAADDDMCKNKADDLKERMSRKKNVEDFY